MFFKSSDQDLNVKLQCFLLNSVAQHDTHCFPAADTKDLHIMFLEQKLRLLIQTPQMPESDRQFLDFLDYFEVKNRYDLHNQVHALIDLDRRPPYVPLTEEPSAETQKKQITQRHAVMSYAYAHDIWTIMDQLHRAYRQTGRAFPRYDFNSYISSRSVITGSLRGTLGRVLHIAARQARHHPEIPLSWQRCFHALNVTQGADALLIEPHTSTAASKTPRTRKKSFKSTLSLSGFKAFKARHHAILPLLAAMDVIWCRHYLPAESAGNWSDTGYECLRDFRPQHSLMDTPADLEIARATVAYASWFRNWGIQNGSHKARHRLLDPALTPALATDIAAAPPVNAPLWRNYTKGDTMLQIEDPISGYYYRVPTQFYGSPEEEAAEDVTGKAPPGLVLPLPPLPVELVSALKSYTDPNTRP